MNSILKVVCSIIWLVGIFVLLAVGLMLFNYNIFAMDFMQNNPWLVTVIYALAGIAGILGLVKFTHHCMGGGSWCHQRDERGGYCGCGMANCPSCRK